MGLGVNAAGSDAIRSVDLSTHTKLKIVSDPEDDATLREYKEEFQRWVIANGLRELHEGFTEYLERLNQACLTISWLAKRYTSEECDRYHKKFHRDGFPEKFKALRSRFNVSTAHENGLLSLNVARNCHTHRRGIVGNDDLNTGDELRLSWRVLEIYFVPADGEPILNRYLPPQGVPMPGGAIESKYIDHFVILKQGQLIDFSPLQMDEICFFLEEAASELAVSAVEFANSLGVEIRERAPRQLRAGAGDVAHSTDELIN